MTGAEPPVRPIDDRLLRVEPEVVLRGWRCARCRRLSLGARETCPLCGNRAGRETSLLPTAVLETWTRVAATPSYVVAYARLGDGEDDQSVLLLGPIDVEDAEGAPLHAGQRLEIRFSTSVLPAGARLHHRFVPEARSS
jgi:uncharacterized OB-fold protein